LSEQAFWDRTAGATASWLATQPIGPIAVGDIGRIGWVTDAPIVDLGGLVEPALAGPATPEWRNALFARDPRYVVVISKEGCTNPEAETLRAIVQDMRFRAFTPVHKVPVGRQASWCIFARPQADPLIH
jgi:hypothetical protein